MFRSKVPNALLFTLLLSACASASDRLEEGMEAEAYGRWYRAANRYIEALEKDARMTEARDRLLEVGDSAITESLRTVEARLSARDAVAAAEEFGRVDLLLAQALRVGVRLPKPEDYQDTRRVTLDTAIRELLAESDDALQRGQWDSGRRAMIRLRRDLEPDRVQRGQSLRLESRLLLGWAHAEENEYHFRKAFGLADEALEVAAQGADLAPRDLSIDGATGAPQDLADAARALQDRAVASGTMGLLVFPVTLASGLEAQSETDPAQLLSDILELDHWRQPPRFISVADPVLVRTVTRRLTPIGMGLRPERVLEELGADFGVLVEVLYLTSTEEDVRRRSRTTRIRRGAATAYSEEEGTLHYEIQAQVLIVDRDGRELEDFLVDQKETGGFQRGVYEGDPGTLDLSRGEARLFDPVVQARRRAEIEEALMVQLAEKIADQVYRRVLNRIP